MDEVFDSGLPAWKSSKIRSARLEQLVDEIARDTKGIEDQSGQVASAPPAPAQTTRAIDPEKLVQREVSLRLSIKTFEA